MGRGYQRDMQLILHIGQSKTGTTALQSFLFHNKKALQNASIIYPDYLLNSVPLHTPEHNVFAETLCGLPRYPNFSLGTYFKQFEEQSQNCHTMILSGESFFGAPQIWRLNDTNKFFDEYQKKLEKLKSFTQNYDTHIIGYFRAPEDWFETATSHIIRYAGLLGTNIYQSDEQLLSLLTPHMNYSKLIKMWEDVLQPQQISIVPYERESLYNKDIILDFCYRMDIDVSSLSFPNKTDEIHGSLDRRYIEVKKRLNAFNKSKAQERIIIECLDRLNKKLPEIEKYQLSSDFRNSILHKHCVQIHQWLNENHTPEGRNSFFLNETKHQTKKSLNELSIEEIDNAHDAFQKLYKSWPIKIMGFKIWAKAFLRNRCSYLYAMIKNLLKSKSTLKGA